MEPGPKDAVRVGVQQRQPHALRVALRIAETEETAVVVCDEVEGPSQRIGERADPLHLGVVGGRCYRRSGAAEAGPVGGNGSPDPRLDICVDEFNEKVDDEA